MSHVVVVGAGIVGMATAARLSSHGHRVTVLEKERDLAEHQSGRNSGIIHSGLYHSASSGKARMAVAGQASMAAFALENQIPVDICGSLVVATDDGGLAGLRALAARAQAEGIPARLMSASEAREHEPHVRCIGALHVETTGVTDYVAVCRALARQVRDAGGDVLLGHAFQGARTVGQDVWISTEHTTLTAQALVVCGGLQADRLARACGLDPQVRILPFRGEYYELAPEARTLVNGLVAPVPDPRFPFLGIHLTRMIHGGVHAGPNALLALSREGYSRSSVNVSDLRATLAWPGLWRLAAENLAPGARETARALSPRRFVRSLRQLLPELGLDDVVPSFTGVRAQAVRRDGALVQDFLLQTAPGQVHVLNAPSPAATAALELARVIERELQAVSPALDVPERGRGSSRRRAS